ncbi:MAG: helix-turn-helix transcriptional regulator [Candidatus Bathyarchaeota archaeon]|nr:MAG: helix-turn-helix transcriptional regulator [Candidatus Bathyarchaeota archaeon]
MSGEASTRVFHALKHGLRREILSLVAEGPVSYTHLLRSLDVESGMLAYHLRNMAELLEKDDESRYVLSELGEAALGIMEGEEAIETMSRPATSGFVRFLFVLFLVGGILSIAYLAASLKEANRAMTRTADEVKAETLGLANISLSVIYSVYEQIDVDRSEWTGLLLNMVRIKANLKELASIGEGDTAGYDSTLASLEVLIGEFMSVLENDDRIFFILTLEKRYLIRDLQMELLGIKSNL